jgi:hypothetical protein
MSSPIQTVFQTRYSYFGQSGWRSNASKAQEMLFDPARLAKRLYLFEHMNLACLRDQSDPEFKLAILTSTLLPEDHFKDLTALCHDMLGPERVHILRRGPGSAGKQFNRFMTRKLSTTPHAVQVVLDDDDALSVDFVEETRREAEFALSRFRPDQDCVYVSFASGLSARFDDDGLLLTPRSVPFTNLGLALVAPSDTPKNPYMLAHKKVARRHPVRVIHDQRPFYIRAVHDTNDSRAMMDKTPLAPEDVATALTYFPLLRNFTLKNPDAASSKAKSA